MREDRLAALRQLDPNVSRETFHRTDTLFEHLLQWQTAINLVAPSTIDDAWHRHILDSWELVKHLGLARDVIDLGSGAGFPGLVVAIALESRQGGTVRLVESAGKKAAFLRNASARLSFKSTSVTVENQRLESLYKSKLAVNTVCARAFASLSDLLRHQVALGLSDKVGIYPKGERHREEIEDAHRQFEFDLEILDRATTSSGVVLKVSDIAAKAV